MKTISRVGHYTCSPTAGLFRTARRVGAIGSIAWLVSAAACSSAANTTTDTDAGAVSGTPEDGGSTDDAGTVKGGGHTTDAGSSSQDAQVAKDAAPVPPSCDLGKDPKDSPACVADGVGLFVDGTSGLDTNDGTKAHPFAHIQAALAKGSSRIYVCAGTYDEHVKITAGVGIYGGFACGTFAFGAANVVSIAPSDAGYAVEIANAAGAVVLEDLSMMAVGGTAAQPSSVAVFAHGSGPVALKRAVAIAGDGYLGTSSTVGSNYDLAMATMGNPGSHMTTTPIAGLAPACDALCKNGVHSSAGKGYGLGGGGIPALPGGPAIAGHAGGAAGAGACNGPGLGQDGAQGPAGTDGATPTRVGTLSALGWTAAVGAAGTIGGPAQGGGGGDGFSSGIGVAYGGGSGACGGCGGAPATAATGGGGSIALLVWETPITLVASSLTTGAGADGGTGAAGQGGQLGGQGGAADGTGGCKGGSGGDGGHGGASAGGAGGVSVGVLYVAKTVSAPVLDAATSNDITNGTAGNRGAGGAGNDGLALPPQKVQDASSI